MVLRTQDKLDTRIYILVKKIQFQNFRLYKIFFEKFKYMYFLGCRIRLLLIHLNICYFLRDNFHFLELPWLEFFWNIFLYLIIKTRYKHNNQSNLLFIFWSPNNFRVKIIKKIKKNTKDFCVFFFISLKKCRTIL